MGDPKKLRKKYSGPRHPWEGDSIEEERAIFYAYGLKNKKEIWKCNSLLRNYKRQAKRLSPLKTNQADREKTQLLKSLMTFGLMQENAVLNDILSLSMTQLLERRLQTIVVKKGLARTMKQARQLIVHGHIRVDKNVVTSPSYLVKKTEESIVVFNPSS